MAIYIFNFSLTPFLPNNRNDGTIHITKEKPTQRLESRAVCEQINKQTVNETMMVVEQTTGWYELQIINKFYSNI
jgi:type IV secretory pathway VirD2 relaxase